MLHQYIITTKFYIKLLKIKQLHIKNDDYCLILFGI
jgi:hypothetical protein